MNEALQNTGAPLKVLSGYIGHVTVSVPWSALLKENCKVEISGLALSVAPHTLPSQTEEQGKHTCVCMHIHVVREDKESFLGTKSYPLVFGLVVRRR